MAQPLLIEAGEHLAMGICERLADAPDHVAHGVLRLRNSDMIEEALGWPYAFVNEVLAVSRLAPDSMLATLLDALEARLRMHVPPAVAAANSLRRSCCLSRSAAREVTRLLTDDVMPLAIRACPACGGDVCARDGFATCTACDRYDYDGPLPRIQPDAGGVCAAVEEMVFAAVADGVVVVVHENPDSPLLVVDSVTFDDDEATMAAAGLIKMQAFVRVK